MKSNAKLDPAKGYNPLTFFWIAEYEDGTAFAEFDPYTGGENLFGDVDHTKLKRFGWHPFTPKIAKKIKYVTKQRFDLPHYVLSVNDGMKVVPRREQHIPYMGNTDRFTIHVLEVKPRSRWRRFISWLTKNHICVRIDEDGNVKVE